MTFRYFENDMRCMHGADQIMKKLIAYKNGEISRPDSLLYYTGFAFEHFEIEPAMPACHAAVSSGIFKKLS